MKHLFYAIITLLAALATQSCIEDSISSSPADQPEFSVDTLHMGMIFTDEGSPTYSFRVYNRHDKIISINSISLAGGTNARFRLNVDGQAGVSFSNVEIRPNDSIFVFVDAVIPAVGQPMPVEVLDAIVFQTAGVDRQVVLQAFGRDVKRLRAHTLTADTTVTASLPLLIYDSLVVSPGVTLTLDPGSQLLFHDKASLIVRGSLRSAGTADSPVTLGGDRSGYVASNIPYDVMSRQWQGVTFHRGSTANSLAYTTIENTISGVVLDSLNLADPAVPAIELINCRLRNSGERVLTALHSSVSATGCEFAEAAQGVVSLTGGTHHFSFCTFTNNYLFSYISGPLISLAHLSATINADQGLPASSATWLKADISNSILYGSGGVLSHPDLEGTDVYILRCLLGVSGTDDTHFVDILWDTVPDWHLDRDRYIFDYRLRPSSPAVGAALPSLTPAGALPLPTTDFYGTPRLAPPSIGAFAPV